MGNAAMLGQHIGAHNGAHVMLALATDGTYRISLQCLAECEKDGFCMTQEECDREALAGEAGEAWAENPIIGTLVVLLTLFFLIAGFISLYYCFYKTCIWDDESDDRELANMDHAASSMMLAC